MKMLRAILITVFILFVTGFYLLEPADPVVKEIVKSVQNPTGKYQAVLFIDTGGGATVDFSNNVAILAASDSNNIRENEKVNKNHIVFKGYHVRYIDIKWENDYTLVIYYDYKNNIIKNLTEADGITIKYVREEMTRK